jgi:putative spermidine/putrescine transport system substrate-binding protein
MAADVGRTASEASEADSLVVTGFGGVYNTCEMNTVIRPFEKKYNVDVTLALPGDSSQIVAKLIAEKGHPSIDVIGGLSLFMPAAVSAGVMEPVNYPKELKNWKDLTPVGRGSPAFGPGIYQVGIGIGYNPKKLGFVPKSWLDLWRPQVRDHVAVFSPIATYGAAMIAVVNQLMGGTQTDVSKAFTKFKALGSNRPVVMLNDNDAMTAFVQKDVWLSPMTTSPAITLQKQGVPIKYIYPKEGGIYFGGYTGIVKDSPNRATALKFLDFWTSPSVQGAWSRCVGYVPANTKAVFPKQYAYRSVLNGKGGVKLDWKWISSNRSSWLDQWNSGVAPYLNG